MTAQGAKLLLVHGSDEAAELLSSNLSAHGFTVELACDAEHTKQAAKSQDLELILLDLGHETHMAIELLAELQRLREDLPVLVMSVPDERDLIISAIQMGAFDWVPKPVDIEKLAATVDSLITRKGFLVEPVSLVEGLREEPGFKKIVGDSASIRNVFRSIEIVRASDVPVLLLGETGTGKDLVAKAIHYRGTRRKNPLVTVNCAAIPETLLESELFGHVKGAFTGADRDRMGKFEEAHKGTIFLDEIADMSPATQAKMLRVIEEKKFERVGGNQSIYTDVRIIAATNQDIGKAVAEGRFRRDLYYRLAVFPVTLPSLRERRNDIPELALYFLQRATARTGKKVHKISDQAMQMLQNYDWPGNVRQLQNCINRAVLLSKNDVVTPEELNLSDFASGEEDVALPEDELGRLVSRLQRGDIPSVDEVEGILIRTSLLRCGGNISDAAKQLGVSRSTIYRKMREDE
ncbi:MAG: sigma-54 dependent transcriptional regulator [Planctomycetota bacterium]